MSNPGVILLASNKLEGMNLKIEDNIGESIHIHLGNIRIDLSIASFFDLVDSLSLIMEKMINIDDFKLSDYDEIFVTRHSSELVRLKEIKRETVELDSLITDSKDENGYISLVPVSDSRVTKALSGDSSEVERREQTNYFGQDNLRRIEVISDSIDKNGFSPEKGSNIVLFGKESYYIMDGCHRASYLKYKFGNIKIPICRWIFSGRDFTDEDYLNHIRKLNRNNELIERVKYILTKDLSGKRVVIKGAGKHTRELLKIMDYNINILGIIDNKVKQGSIEGIPILDDEFMSLKPDVILISSFYQRSSMKYDVMKYSNRVEIYDLYDHGIEREFFSK